MAPNPPDDSADALRGYAVALADAVDAALSGWVQGCVRRRCAESGVEFTSEVAADAADVGERCAAEVGVRVRALLMMDPDQQDSTPMTLLRAATVYPTEVLDRAGVPPVQRDEFSVRNFPADVHRLTPANFGEIDESIQDPGLAWGAAKAYVHLERRR